MTRSIDVEEQLTVQTILSKVYESFLKHFSFLKYYKTMKEPLLSIDNRLMQVICVSPVSNIVPNQLSSCLQPGPGPGLCKVIGSVLGSGSLLQSINDRSWLLTGLHCSMISPHLNQSQESKTWPANLCIYQCLGWSCVMYGLLMSWQWLQ